jgi:drug/metabolite transporter (DMT)-like permease
VSCRHVHSRGAPTALAAVALWATNAFAATVALDSLSVLQLLAVQYGSAALALALWRSGGRVVNRSSGAPLSLLDWPGVPTVAIGLLGLTGTIFLQYWAFATAPIVGANVIAYGWPLMAALWMAVTVRSRETLVGVPLAALGFLGVVIILGGWEVVAGGVEIGYIIALGSAVCMTFYTVAAGRIDTPATDLLLPATTVGVVLAVTGSLLQGTPWPPVGQWWPAVYIGIGPMAAGYWLWTYAMADHRADRLSPIGYATPLLSTLLLLATGQPFTAATLVGAALILVCSTGVLINERIAHQRASTANREMEPVQKTLREQE